MAVSKLGARIKHLLTVRGWTQAELAAKLKVTPQAITKWVKTGVISRENLLKMSRIFNVTSEWLMSGDAEGGMMPNTALVGKVAGRRCPLKSWKVKEDNLVVDHYPCAVECSEETFILKVRGIAMNPRFIEGELIFIDPQAEYKSGDYVLIAQADMDDYIFRRYIDEDGVKCFQAENPNWAEPIIPFSDDLVVVGKVISKSEIF